MKLKLPYKAGIRGHYPMNQPLNSDQSIPQHPSKPARMDKLMDSAIDEAAVVQQITDQLSDRLTLISHELRTPMTSIYGVLGLLNNGQLGSLSADGQHLLSIAIQNAHRLIRFINLIEQDGVLPFHVLSAQQMEEFQLETDLQEAFDRREFQLQYQPIISSESECIIGFEALARWHHPSRGVISPTIFIPLLEKMALIHRLGLWVLEQACHQLAYWQQQFEAAADLTMSVNLSTLQLQHPDFVKQVEEILQTTGVNPRCLKLEITESALIENYPVAFSALSALRALGVQFYIDDFGTGYSSLGRLHNLPIDALKLDRSFVQSKQWGICETIILMATRLRLGVIAEGVETVEELLSLKALGCIKMQGYFFHKPLDHQTASELLACQFS